MRQPVARQARPQQAVGVHRRDLEREPHHRRDPARPGRLEPHRQHHVGAGVDGHAHRERVRQAPVAQQPPADGAGPPHERDRHARADGVEHRRLRLALSDYDAVARLEVGRDHAERGVRLAEGPALEGWGERSAQRPVVDEPELAVEPEHSG